MQPFPVLRSRVLRTLFICAVIGTLFAAGCGTSSKSQLAVATINGAPAITSANSAPVTAGTAGTFIVTTTGSPIPTLAATVTLPGGVTFTDNKNGTGTLAWTAAVTSAAYSMTFMASNGMLPNGTQNFTLNVSAAPSALQISTLSETSGNPFDPFTITGTGFGQGNLAISVVFTPENGDTPVMIPVSASNATSVQAMVPTFLNTPGAFSGETVDVQVVEFSSNTTYLSNTIKGLVVSGLPPVPSGVPAGVMTAAVLSSALNISASIQNVATGHASLSNASAALAQLNQDISPVLSAANTIASNLTQSVNLTTANGTTISIDAQILAESDQLAQALIAAVVKQGSIPILSSSVGCPAATGNTIFDNNLCSAQIYFQTYASQATPAFRPRTAAARPELAITPPDKAALTLFANLALGSIAEFCEPAGGAVIYSLVGAPIVTGYISSLAVNQETPPGTEVVQGVGLNFLDNALFNKIPVLGLSVDLVKGFVALVKYSPPANGILLSSGAATFLPGGQTFVDPNSTAPTILVKVPSAPQGAAFDTTTYVVPPPATNTLTLGTNGSGSGSITSFPTGTSFPVGTVVAVTAVPDAGSSFTGWGGDCSGAGGCSVTMSTNRSVTANFSGQVSTTVSVTPGTANLGSVSGCTGGQLSQTYQVIAPPGIPWSAGIYGNSNSYGYGITSVSPSTGSGPGSFTVTVSVIGIMGQGEACNFSSQMSGIVVIYFTNGMPGNDQVFVTATWNLIT
jgi:large repetitive protein